jgi:hypothetical protein
MRAVLAARSPAPRRGRAGRRPSRACPPGTTARSGRAGRRLCASLRAISMWISASRLPMPREPECSITQTRSSVVQAQLDEVVAAAERAQLRAGLACAWSAAPGPVAALGKRAPFRREGAAFSACFGRPAPGGREAHRHGASPRACAAGASVVGQVIAAAGWCAPRPCRSRCPRPPPRRTPRAFIAMTEPTVAPLPRCTSGMTRHVVERPTAAAPMLRSCASAAGSTSRGSAHISTSASLSGRRVGNSGRVVSSSCDRGQGHGEVTSSSGHRRCSPGQQATVCRATHLPHPVFPR